MDFVNLPLFESWTEKRDQLAAQRTALRLKTERGDMAWSTAEAEDAIVVWRLLNDLVRAGQIEPTIAEVEFNRLNCGPLVPEPNPARFDPEQEAHWTVEMSLAWIMWRQMDDVRRHWDKYRSEKRSWQPRDVGFVLRSMRRTSYFELRHDELITQPAEDNVPLVSSDQARFELWRALEAGTLSATGVDAQTEKRIDVPAREFIDLDLHDDEDGLFPQKAVRAAYVQLRLPSARIQHLWPKRSVRNESLASARSKCRAWFEVQMRASPDKAMTSKADDLKLAQDMFPGLSAEGFKSARADAIVATGAHAWSNPGRKPKSSGAKSPGQ